MVYVAKLDINSRNYTNCISKCHKRNRIIFFFSKAKNLSIASLWFCFLTQIKEKRNYLYMTDGDSTGIIPKFIYKRLESHEMSLFNENKKPQ